MGAAELVRYFWLRAMSKKRSTRARIYSEFEWAGLSSKEMREAWAYCRQQHPFVGRGLVDIALENSKQDMMRLVRAAPPVDYLLTGIVHGGMNSLRTADEILVLVEGHVPPAYAACLPGTAVGIIVRAWQELVPVPYARAATAAGLDPIAAWESGVPDEYLV